MAKKKVKPGWNRRRMVFYMSTREALDVAKFVCYALQAGHGTKAARTRVARFIETQWGRAVLGIKPSRLP